MRSKHSMTFEGSLSHSPQCMQRMKDMDVKFIEVKPNDEKDFSGVESGDVVILPAFGASVQVRSCTSGHQSSESCRRGRAAAVGRHCRFCFVCSSARLTCEHMQLPGAMRLVQQRQECLAANTQQRAGSAFRCKACVQEMRLLSERGVQIVDTTCPWVAKVWNAVDKQATKDHTSIIHGKWQHEETVATASFAGDYLIVKDKAEARYVADYILQGGDKAEFLEKFKNAGVKCCAARMYPAPHAPLATCL